MKPEPNYEPLLHDLFMDEDLRALHEKVFKRCSDTLHRRRIRRSGLRIGTGIAAMLLFALLLYTAAERPRVVPEETYLVRTVPLADKQIVHTTGMADLVQTRSNGGWMVATADAPDVVVRGSYRVARISDSDLLDAFKGRPCGIIHAPDGSAQFVFFRPEDTQRFFYSR